MRALCKAKTVLKTASTSAITPTTKEEEMMIATVMEVAPPLSYWALTKPCSITSSPTLVMTSRISTMTLAAQTVLLRITQSKTLSNNQGQIQTNSNSQKSNQETI